jgi:hypothetical protein
MTDITFLEIQRNEPFHKIYNYKIYTNVKVYWTPEYENWHSEEDRKWMKKIECHLKAKFGNNIKFQGAVIYCKDLDEAFLARLLCGEKIVKVEKAIMI